MSFGHSDRQHYRQADTSCLKEEEDSTFDSFWKIFDAELPNFCESAASQSFNLSLNQSLQQRKINNQQVDDKEHNLVTK